MIRWRLLLSAALLTGIAPFAAAGCGERVLLGGSELGQNPACMNAACGVPCSLRACASEAPGPPGAVPPCDTPDVMGFCSLDGSCVPSAPDCPPPPPPPCQDHPCGTPCKPACTPGNPSCAGMGTDPYQCDTTGACVPGPIMCPCVGPDCPPPPPCLDKPCGAPCDPCTPMDPMCPPPPVKMVCNGMSACVPATESGCPPQPWHPCDQMPCGAPCQLCPPGDPMCIEPPGIKSCDEMGTCVLGMFACGDAGAADGGMGGP